MSGSSPGRTWPTVAVLGVLLAAAALAGCGQRGPLVLPESAQPIEPAPADAPTAPGSDPQDDERENER